MREIIIVGGGAGGFFTAINIAENCPNCKITILEGSSHLLKKVKTSGGGRCNVTHACFDPKELVQFYPRGHKELLGAFHQFMTRDMMEWLEQRGVALKIEDDNRVFPKSNHSQTIIDCFLGLAEKYKINVLTNHRVTSLHQKDQKWIVSTNKQSFTANSVVIATGSNTEVWKLLEKMEMTIVPPVPSLFTFRIKDEEFTALSGISMPDTSLTVKNLPLTNYGAILITHKGLSGPAILKLSAFGANLLANKNYQFELEINWLSTSKNEVLNQLKSFRTKTGKNFVNKTNPFYTVPKRLWEYFLKKSQISLSENWGNTTNKQLEQLSEQLTKSTFKIIGKNTFKDEFVTAGGVDLKEINCKRFESKKFPNLFFTGEVLNIDGVTGGFNFQNAWTTGWIVSQAVSNIL